MIIPTFVTCLWSVSKGNEWADTYQLILYVIMNVSCSLLNHDDSEIFQTGCSCSPETDSQRNMSETC